MKTSYLTSENINKAHGLLFDFVNDVKYYEKIRKPVKVKQNSIHVTIYPTIDGTFPSGREQWFHDNDEYNILCESARKVIYDHFNTDLFKI